MQTLAPTLSIRRLRPQGERTRLTIASVIWEVPGIRYRELARTTKLAHGTLSHHIKILQRQRRIIVRRDSGSTRLFPDNYDDALCNAIASASHPTTLAIVTMLLRRECNYWQIKKAIIKADSTICQHLKRLQSAGLVARRRIDRSSVYTITDADKAIMIMNRGKYRECQGTN